MSVSSMIKSALNKIGGIYVQFLIVVALMIIFAFLLNGIFSIDDNEVRIIYSSLFLAAFTGVIAVFRRI